MCHNHKSTVPQLARAQAREGRGIILSLHNKHITPYRESSPRLLHNTVQLHTSLKKNVQDYLTVTNIPRPVPYHWQTVLAHNGERQKNRISSDLFSLSDNYEKTLIVVFRSYSCLPNLANLSWESVSPLPEHENVLSFYHLYFSRLPLSPTLAQLQDWLQRGEKNPWCPITDLCCLVVVLYLDKRWSDLLDRWGTH